MYSDVLHSEQKLSELAIQICFIHWLFLADSFYDLVRWVIHLMNLLCNHYISEAAKFIIRPGQPYDAFANLDGAECRITAKTLESPGSPNGLLSYTAPSPSLQPSSQKLKLTPPVPPGFLPISSSSFAISSFLRCTGYSDERRGGGGGGSDRILNAEC